jgi:hypothetical protein
MKVTAPMSVRALEIVFRARIEGRKKLVLIGLANHADDNGENCFPKIKRLAKELGCTPFTIRRALAEVTEDGFVTRTERRRPDGGRSTDDYRLDLKALKAIAASDPPPQQSARGAPQQSAGEAPQQSAGEAPQQIADQPPQQFAGDKEQSKEPSPKRSGNASKKTESRRVPGGTPTSEAFDRFKAAYPKRRGGDAWKIAAKIFHRKLSDGADAEAIIVSAKRLAEQMAEEKKIGTEFVPMAKTWLNQERWDTGESDKPVDPYANKIKVAVNSEQGQVWASFERYMRYLVHFELPKTRIDGAEYYLVDTAWPSEPIGKVFVERGPRLDEWCRYENAEGRGRFKITASPFQIAGQIKHGWWFDTDECPFRWVDADSAEGIALDELNRGKRFPVKLTCERTIDGVKRRGFWNPKIQPELKAAA